MAETVISPTGTPIGAGRVKRGQNPDLFLISFSLLFCILRLGQVRDLQSGTYNSAGKALFAV